MRIIKNYQLKKLTTIRIGGPAKYFVMVKTEQELQKALKFAKSKRMKWAVLGEGSNLIVSDKGFPGLIIQNKIQYFKRKGTLITVGAGNNLLKLILELDDLGLAGLEKMAGIPGTVGGAIYGCAGAYGQEIYNYLLNVRFFDGKKFRNFTKKQCRFGYRSSIFKKSKNWIITGATFRLRVGEGRELAKVSKEIIKLRSRKYLSYLKSPGSFFKNIKLSDIKPAKKRQAFLRKIDESRIIHGKVPVGYLLEKIGACRMRKGQIKVASYHGNLIYNIGNGKAREVKDLVRELKKLVKNKFGITIEEEVQYL